jgi:hypothetical protein
MLNPAVKGQPLDGRVVYGYRIRYREGVDSKGRHKLVPVCYELDPKTVPIVQLIFRLAVTGSTLGEIAQELYRRGVPSFTGKSRWSQNVLLRLLKKRKFVSDFVWGERATGKRMRLCNGTVRQCQPGEKQSRRNDPESCTLKRDAHEALIDRKTFQKVQALLAGNQGRSTPHVGGVALCCPSSWSVAHCRSHLRGLTRKDGARVLAWGATSITARSIGLTTRSMRGRFL